MQKKKLINKCKTKSIKLHRAAKVFIDEDNTSYDNVMVSTIMRQPQASDT